MAKIRPYKDNSQLEMFRLLKIFGFASLGLVFILSFFNEQKANNSGEDPTFTIKDAGLLFFYNVRRIDYQIQRLPETRIEIYNHKSFEKDSTKNAILLDLILNKNTQTAFLYLKTQGSYSTPEALKLRNGNLPMQDTLTLSTGTADRHVHLGISKSIAHWLEQEDGSVEIYADNKWLPLYADKNQKEAFVATFRDFLKITATR